MLKFAFKTPKDVRKKIWDGKKKFFSRGLGPQWNEKDPWPTFDPKIERKWPFLAQNREERKP